MGDGPERDLFRSTAMHNTLRVDDASQCEPAGPFGWKQLAHAKVEQWITGETFDLFVGSHDGYNRLASPAVHQRWVFALKSGLFLVRDLARGAGEHRLDISWHLGPEMQMHVENVFRVRGTASGLAVLCADKHGWSEEVRKDVWAPVYGKKEPIAVLNFGTVSALPAEFVTLLVPLEEVRTIPGKLTQMKGEAATAVKAYLYSAPSEEYSFFFAEPGHPWKHQRLASDAGFVCWQRTREREDELLIVCNGSYVEIDGRRLLGRKRAISHYEVRRRDSDKGIYTSE